MHGEILYNELKATGANVYFISGDVDIQERERIRQLIDTEQGVIVVASVGTTSTGINIVNLNNIIFASPTKSKIRTLQSIGRGLRRGAEKTHFTLIDIADDLSVGDEPNHTLRHFIARLKIYVDEDFPYRVDKVKMKT